MFERIKDFLGLQDEEEMDEEIEEQQDYVGKQRSKKNIVSIHSQKKIKLILQEPRSYDEAQEVAENLRSHRPVVVNLQQLSPELAIRYIDFLSGCVFALNGNIKKVGDRTFICTSENIDVQGAISEFMQREQEEQEEV